MQVKKTLTLRPKKYDWKALKIEYLQSEHESVTDFLRSKNMIHCNLENTNGWRAEKDNMKLMAVEKAKQQIVNGEVHDINEAKARQARLARFMQLKGTAALKTLEPKDTEEARKLIVSGMETERKVLGMDAVKPTSLTQINIGPKTNLDKLVEGMNYEGVLRLIAELKQHRARVVGETVAPNGEAEAEQGEVV